MGRESREAIYRIELPANWTVSSPDINANLSDTRDPIDVFHINDTLRVVVHSFPNDIIEERIPSMAQVTRWKRQFSHLEGTDSVVIPQAFAGYIGLLFEGTGIFEGERKTVLAWALQIAPEHHFALSNFTKKRRLDMRGDVTLKIIGDPDSIEERLEEIMTALRSFELIEEIPNRL